MDDIDRAIINRIQSNFPITSKPYHTIAQELNISEKDVLNRIQNLKDNQIIRRIGANFVPEKMGYVSTLCAAHVPDHLLDSFADIVNQNKGVTHNYIRDNYYNVWFTIIAPSMDHIETFLHTITEQTSVHQILNLPATHVFKIKAQFNV